MASGPSFAEVEALLGAAHVNVATAADAVAGVVPAWVAAPADEREAATLLEMVSREGARVAIRGGGSKMDWGARPEPIHCVLSTHRMNRIVEHAWNDMTVTVESGCLLRDVQVAVAERGQRFAVDPCFAERATVGGILASADAGPLRTRYGGARGLVLGLTTVLADGTIARSGGRVVKNVAGYDLPKLFTGSMGTLGVITQATLRLHGLPAAVRSVSFAAAGPEQALATLREVGNAGLRPACLQLRVSPDAAAVDARFESAGTGAAAQARLAARLGAAENDETCWAAVERLRQTFPLVTKVGLLLTGVTRFLEALLRELVEWCLVLQSDGVGLLGMSGVEDPAGLLANLRQAARPGYLVVQQCPVDWRAAIDHWGTARDALGVMRRVKAQFDPHGTLVPSRFLGDAP